MIERLRRIWQRLGSGSYAGEPAQTGTRALPDRHAVAPRLIVGPQRFVLSADLLEALRATRPFCDYEDRVAWEHDAFLLSRSDDIVAYLSADGRLLWLTALELVPDLALSYATLAAGARAIRVSALRALLPGRPARTPDCADCAGRGFRELPAADEATTLACVCRGCAGLGFVQPELVPPPRASS